MRYLLFSAACTICFCCSSDYRYMHSIEADANCIANLAPRQLNTSWYHAGVDVAGSHISGLLLIKNMPDSSIRVVFTSEAGVTFFDFGFAEGNFKVHNIIGQLNKKPVIQTLRKDFELILGLSFQGASYQSWTMNDEVFYGVKQKKETAYFITTKDCASLRRLELASSRKRKVTVLLSGQSHSSPEKIEIRHHTFNMKINLSRFEKE